MLHTTKESFERVAEAPRNASSGGEITGGRRNFPVGSGTGSAEELAGRDPNREAVTRPIGSEVGVKVTENGIRDGFGRSGGQSSREGAKELGSNRYMSININGFSRSGRVRTVVGKVHWMNVVAEDKKVDPKTRLLKRAHFLLVSFLGVRNTRLENISIERKSHLTAQFMSPVTKEEVPVDISTRIPPSGSLPRFIHLCIRKEKKFFFTRWSLSLQTIHKVTVLRPVSCYAIFHLTIRTLRKRDWRTTCTVNRCICVMIGRVH